MKSPTAHGRRHAATLIELLMAVGVIAVLVGLILVAVQQARQQAARATGMNSCRQLLLASQNYASQHNGWLVPADAHPEVGVGCVLSQLLPYLDGGADLPPTFFRLATDSSGAARLPIAVPAVGKTADLVISSFALNAVCYALGARVGGVHDGLSNTLAITEHYGTCGPTTFQLGLDQSYCFDASGRRQSCSEIPCRRPTFADYPTFDDVHPVTSRAGGSPVTVGSLPLTFQVRPTLSACDPRIPQSSLPGGILAGCLDGSVRFLRPDMAPEVFWGGVTPAGGESVNLD